MPGPDEIRRHQEEQPISPAMRKLLAGIPKVEFDPLAMRRRLAERFQEYMENPPNPNQDHPYIKDTAP